MRFVVLCATLVAVLPASAGAQSLPLTEQEALARLSPDSPRVRGIRAAIDVARADVLAAGRWPNPRVTVDRESVAGVTEYLTMVAQPLAITGRHGLEMQAASALVDATSNRIATKDAPALGRFISLQTVSIGLRCASRCRKSGRFAPDRAHVRRKSVKIRRKFPLNSRGMVPAAMLCDGQGLCATI